MFKRNDVHIEASHKKKRLITVLGAAFLLLAVVFLWIVVDAAQAAQREWEEIAQVFQPYEPYGLVYREKENRLYYRGELVRYFEDIVSMAHYLKWPNQNGTVDVYAERDIAGELTGVKAFTQEEFSDRTPSMKTAGNELIINIDGGISNGDIEEMVKRQIAEAYEVYQPYGLTYDKESDRLYYNGELVGYFEDKQIKHFFGPFQDSSITIYAIRDENGALTGLDVEGAAKQ